MRLFVRLISLTLMLVVGSLSAMAFSGNHKPETYKVSRVVTKGIKKIHKAMANAKPDEVKALYASLLEQQMSAYEKAFVLQDLAMFDFNHQDNAGALAAYQQILSLGDGVPPALRDNTALGAAQFYAVMGQNGKAIEVAYELYTAHAGEDDRIRDGAERVLINGYYITKDYTRALELMEKRMNRPDVQRSFQQMYLLKKMRISSYEELGQYLKAKDLILAELDMGSSPELCLELAEIYQKMGVASLVEAKQQAAESHTLCKKADGDDKLKLGF